MVLGFCNERNRKLACESPTITPTPDPILSQGKREDQGKEEVRKRETDQEEMGNESACRPAGAVAESRFPKKTKCLQPSEQLPRHGFGTNDRILLHLSQQALVPKNTLFANKVLFQILWALVLLSARSNIWPSTLTVWRMASFQQLLVSKSSPPLTFHPASETASCIRYEPQITRACSKNPLQFQRLQLWRQNYFTVWNKDWKQKNN